MKKLKNKIQVRITDTQLTKLVETLREERITKSTLIRELIDKNLIGNNQMIYKNDKK